MCLFTTKWTSMGLNATVCSEQTNVHHMVGHGDQISAHRICIADGYPDPRTQNRCHHRRTVPIATGHRISITAYNTQVSWWSRLQELAQHISWIHWAQSGLFWDSVRMLSRVGWVSAASFSRWSHQRSRSSGSHSSTRVDAIVVVALVAAEVIVALWWLQQW